MENSTLNDLEYDFKFQCGCSFDFCRWGEGQYQVEDDGFSCSLCKKHSKMIEEYYENL